MTQEEIKKFIAEKVDEDLSLSQIQDLLTEKGVKMTFMDLRLIASEIESGVWTRHEADSAPTSGSSGPLSEEEEDVPEGDDFPGEEEEDFPEDKAAAANTASAAPSISIRAISNFIFRRMSRNFTSGTMALRCLATR